MKCAIFSPFKSLSNEFHRALQWLKTYTLHNICHLQIAVEECEKFENNSRQKKKKWEPFRLMVYCCSPMFCFFFIYAFSWFRFVAVALVRYNVCARVFDHMRQMNLLPRMAKSCQQQPFFSYYNIFFYFFELRVIRKHSHRVATMIYAHKSEVFILFA